MPDYGMADSFRMSRSAWRALARSPGLVIAAVISLGVGIAANLTVFGVLRAIEFPVLPYADGARLVQIDASNVVRGAAGYPVSLADFDDIRRSSRSFSSVGASSDAIVTIREGTEPARIGVKRVTGGFFTTLGTPAALGRVYTDGDARATNALVASDRLWRDQLRADPNAIGKSVRLDGDLYTVVGVMPPTFDENVDAWVPLRENPAAAPRDDRQYTAIARLRPGVSLEAAQADLAAIAARLSSDFGRTNGGWELSATPFSRLRARESGGGWFQLQAAVAILLLVACANVANLLLARAVGRRRELAIRTALGASRWERFRLVFAEGVLLAVLATTLGAAASVWATGAVTALAGLPESVHVPLDVLTAITALVLALAVAFVIACGPATMAARIDADTALRESGTNASASRGQRRFRTLLLYTEVAAALVLITGASLMARTLWNRQQRDLGFDPQHALRGEIDFSERRYDDVAALRSAVARLRTSVGAQPGVRAVGASSFPFESRLGSPVPLTDPASGNDLLGADTPRVVESTTPEFFAAMATPLRRGRDFSASDVAGGAPVAIVNEELARRAWPNADPIGRVVRISAVANGADVTATVTVVGVVASALRSSMHDRPQPYLYVPFDQFSGRTVTLFVRAADAPERLFAGVKASLREIDPSLFVEDLKTLGEDEAGFLRPTRLYAIMLQAFAAVALVLAAIGVYASMAYSVAQRTRELAIRLALGADPGRLVRHVLRDGVRVAIVGAVVGVLVARAGGRMLSSLVYGVGTTDPMSFAASVLAIALAVVAGTWIPARRASVTDPAIALKAD
jgi:predicted permease